jgi:hypothetical protein
MHILIWGYRNIFISILNAVLYTHSQVVGMITRADMNEHRLAHFWQEEGEQMQKDMNIDSLPVAIGYEMKENQGYRKRTESVQSDGWTVESTDNASEVSLIYTIC